MKKLLRNLVAGVLALSARAVLRKYKPLVVMVTGSVGKTSTKDAVAAALARHAYVRASEKSNNSEFGVPLTVLGCKNPWTSSIGWLAVFGEAFALRWLPNVYPKILVLEVGADSPGDLARILRIATPDAVLVTRLPAMPVHVEAYATPDAVREEEFQPAYALAPGQPLILSADDEYAMTLAAPLATRAVTFGLTEGADVRLVGVAPLIEDGVPVGMRAEVRVAGNTYPLVVRGAIGAPQLLAPAAALATALALAINIREALAGLESYQPPAGRGRLIRGKEGSVIIDDTYNASPAAVEEALASLALIASKVPGMRRIAVLGDMLELGRYSHDEHERIGHLAAANTDVLVTVGSRARVTAEAAIASGMAADQVHSFDTSVEAAAALVPMVGAKDAVLVKGSQSIRTERIVEALLERPEDTKLLVRQEREWKRR
ncbi:MAG TPA: Mur ligase family protein [Candidatus Paceibacterota bacterium]|jgi:UDP-N-acetylmuramoyl-tripeptide--D-alanyl-D-alanine ligase